ncbi:MAG: DUF4870 domain-containing protein [Prevotella sp.]|jgi:uncharacterized Tic20 family protein|nr:DUF4870 domain-containing protein [Prevotella sp.]
MSKYDDLNKLEELRRQGVITEEEYQYEKAKILNDNNHTGGAPDEKTYITLMHLSQFAGFLVPGLGFLAPIIMWLIKSKESADIDRHGKNIGNFMISMIIYAIISTILIPLIIGIPMLIALGIIEIVFVIIASIKAANGEYWKYPLSISFFK